MFKAYFTFVSSGLSIGFVNLSSGNPDVFNWDFGDGHTSNVKDPVCVYAKPGIYEVKLEITSTGDATLQSSITLSVTVSAFGTQSPYGIFISIHYRIPASLLPEDAAIDSMIKKWQLTLADLVDPHMSPDEMYNENLWPPIVNELILNLVMYDMVTDALVKMAYAASAATTGGSNSSEASSTGGGLKAVETGPAKAEFFDNAVSSGQSASYLAKTFQAGAGSKFQGQLGSRICILAARCRIPIEICPPLQKPVFAPSVHRNRP